MSNVATECSKDEVFLSANQEVLIALVSLTEGRWEFFSLDFELLWKISSTANKSLVHLDVLMSHLTKP